MVEREKNITMDDMLKDAGAYVKVYEGDTEHGAVLLGQSIGIIDSIKDVNDIIEGIIKQAENVIRKNSAMLK